MIMTSFQKMNQLMDNHIFQAFRCLTGQLKIQAYLLLPYIAGAPSGGHIPKTPALRPDPNDPLPMG